MTNVAQILAGLEHFERVLRNLKQALADRRDQQLKEALAYSRKVREKLPSRSKGILSSVHEIVVHVVDRPGAIHEATGVLAEKASTSLILKSYESERVRVALSAWDLKGARTWNVPCSC